MKFAFSLVILLGLTVNNVFAQCKCNSYNECFTEGNFLILEENYSQALKAFRCAYEYDSTSANINYKLGFVYLKIPDQKHKALPYLEKAVQNAKRNYTPDEPREKSAPVNAHYYLAMAYHLNYRFDDAIARFNTYSEYLHPKKQADLVKDVAYRIEIAKNAKEFVSAPLDVQITNMGDSVNSPYPEYGPVISVDESMLIFTSRRGSTEKTIDDQFYEDIYISFRQPDSTWTKPVSISPNINTDSDHEAAIGLSADGQTLLVYKDDNGGDIYFSQLQGDSWSPLVKMGYENNSDINTAAWEPSASITADGKTLYFVSDRKGGYGGRDIYRAVKLPNGKWSKALNLGPVINTPYDEDAPFIHPDQKTLFFSSKGHKNMGGFDIFFSSLDPETGWIQPVNMGYPINSPDDDVFYVTSADGKRAYYATTKDGGFGEKDLYVISFKQHTITDPIALIIGDLIPPKGEPIPENEITATNLESGEIVQISRARTRDGRFVISLKPGGNYGISYTVNGEEIKNETLNVPSDIVYEEISRKIYIGGAPDSLAMRDPGTDPKDPKAPKENEVYTISVTLSSGSSPIANSQVKVTDAAGKVVQNTTTDANGTLILSELPPNSYTITVADEIEGDLSASISVSSSTKGNVNVKTTQQGAATAKFQLDNARKSTITVKANKKKPVVTADPKNNNLDKFTGNEFKMNFKYNVNEIDPQSESFTKFIDALVSEVNNKGAVEVRIMGSASTVPTRKFSSNKALAQTRAENAKLKVIDALKAKGVDMTKVNISQVKGSVNGPAYSGDYDLNRSKYEQHQYVRITVYSK